jgi:hypothetical protein
MRAHQEEDEELEVEALQRHRHRGEQHGRDLEHFDRDEDGALAERVGGVARPAREQEKGRTKIAADSDMPRTVPSSRIA